MSIQRSNLNKVLRELEVMVGCGIAKQGDFFNNVDDWFNLIISKYGKMYNHNVGIVQADAVSNVNIVKVFDGAYRKNYCPVIVGSEITFFPIHTSVDNCLRKEVSILTPPIKFYEIIGGSILLLDSFGPCYFDSCGNLIEDLSTPYAKILFYIDVCLEDLIKKPCIYEPGLVLLDRCLEPNYAHWLLDWMPRHIINSSGEKLVLPKLKNAWQKDMLSFFSHEADHIFLEDFELAAFSKLTVPSCGGRRVEHPAIKGHPRIIEFLRSKINLIPSRITTFPEVVIVYRKGSRELKNLNDICDFYIEAGMSVCIVDCSKISIQQQWTYFSLAKIVIGVHGAALASSVFMSPGSVLVEIFPKSYGNPAFWIASSGLNVCYISVTDVIEEDLDKKPRERGLRLTKEIISSFVNCSIGLIANENEA